MKMGPLNIRISMPVEQIAPDKSLVTMAVLEPISTGVNTVLPLPFLEYAGTSPGPRNGV